jgi:small-conductance mechanosensitive channel
LAQIGKWEPTTTAAVRLAANIGTWTGGAIIAMHALGMPTGALITTFGLGGAGATFAAKDLIANPLEGVKVLLNQPFLINQRSVATSATARAGIQLQHRHNRDDHCTATARPKRA